MKFGMWIVIFAADRPLLWVKACYRKKQLKNLVWMRTWTVLWNMMRVPSVFWKRLHHWLISCTDYVKPIKLLFCTILMGQLFSLIKLLENNMRSILYKKIHFIIIIHIITENLQYRNLTPGACWCAFCKFIARVVDKMVYILFSILKLISFFN